MQPRIVTERPSPDFLTKTGLIICFKVLSIDIVLYYRYGGKTNRRHWHDSHTSYTNDM
jgi:hypothetical protein